MAGDPNDDNGQMDKGVSRGELRREKRRQEIKRLQAQKEEAQEQRKQALDQADELKTRIDQARQQIEEWEAEKKQFLERSERQKRRIEEIGSRIEKLQKRKGALWWAAAAAIGAVAMAVIAGLLQSEGPSLPDPTPRQTTTTTSRATTTTTTTRVAVTTTTRAPQTPMDAAERCFSAWDGNHNDFERQVRELLNDPDSMETHGTYFNTEEDISDGTMTIRMDYGARNQLGGMVRTDAIAEMNVRTCEVTVIDYGFE